MNQKPRSFMLTDQLMCSRDELRDVLGGEPLASDATIDRYVKLGILPPCVPNTNRWSVPALKSYFEPSNDNEIPTKSSAGQGWRAHKM